MLPSTDHTFSFNPEKFDFWEIYECISKYYPIGIPKDEAGFWQSYKGSSALAAIITDNTHDQLNFKKRWVDFDVRMAKLVNKEVTGTTNGQSPCFSSCIVIETQQAGGLTRYKELHYFISLAGKFYTVIGEDRNELQQGKDFFRTVNCLVVSPEFDFADLFTKLCEIIQEQFNGFRFVPFGICKQRITGLNTGDACEVRDTVFDAIFGSNYISVKAPNITGDEFYKAADWIIPGYEDKSSNWTIFPPDRKPGKI